MNPEQRIGVLVDVQNLYYSARALYDARVNFDAILKDVVKGRKLIRAIAYAIKAGDKEEDTFHQALSRIGFEVRLKPLQIFYGGNKKADWDVGIAMDAIELAPKLDVVVLVSGDGDYIPLVDHLRRALGCRVEAAAFGRSTSSKLREAVDGFLDLDDKKYVFSSSKEHKERNSEKPLFEHPREHSLREHSSKRSPRSFASHERPRYPDRGEARGKSRSGLDVLHSIPVFGSSSEVLPEKKEEISKPKIMKKKTTKKKKKTAS